MSMSMGMSNNAQTSHILGVDFGLSKIGLAIADEETRMAFTLDVLANDKNFFNKLQDIVIDKNIKVVIIGMTKHEKDPESAKMKDRFSTELKNKLGLEIFFQEEMFSTKLAQENIKMHGGKNISKTDDQEAARIILQEWLDNNRM